MARTAAEEFRFFKPLSQLFTNKTEQDRLMSEEVFSSLYPKDEEEGSLLSLSKQH